MRHSLFILAKQSTPLTSGLCTARLALNAAAVLLAPPTTAQHGKRSQMICKEPEVIHIHTHTKAWRGEVFAATQHNSSHQAAASECSVMATPSIACHCKEPGSCSWKFWSSPELLLLLPLLQGLPSLGPCSTVCCSSAGKFNSLTGYSVYTFTSLLHHNRFTLVLST